MRPYFKQILEETYETFGTRQCENMDDEQYTRLLDKLVFVSSLYPYIPEDEQKKIINKRLVTDKEYRNINARLISGWLEQDGKIFFNQECHTPVTLPEEYKPLEGEAREKAIKEALDAIARTVTNFSNTTEIKGNGAKMREQLDNAGIIIPEPKEEKPQPTYFCLKTNICKEQCVRCKSEQEIISKSEELTNQKP